MNCTRCNKKLIDGKNIPKDWHVPICKECREKLILNKSWGTTNLTDEERKIMNERLKEEK